MRNKEVDLLRSTVRNHLIESGPYSYVLVDISYANVLKKELNCTEPEFAKYLDIKHLSVVDGLENDFVIIP